MPMNPDDRRIDQGVRHVRLVAAGVEKPFENISSHPISEADEDRVPRKMTAVGRAKGRTLPMPWLEVPLFHPGHADEP